jgi:octanoyl-[GcvH]:protein N-octanoyltransferase
MRVLRGRAGSIDADRATTDAMVERALDADEPAVRAWSPHRQIAFGRRDANDAGYEHAREIARERGYRPIEREVGGRAVAYTGSTVAFAYVDPITDRTAIESRYENAIDRLQAALANVGVDARAGEPDRSFCPGTHSLQSAGKIAGLAQRVRRRVAQVGGIVVVRDHDEIGAVLGPIYSALGVAFDPDTVGSVAAAGGEGDPTAVVQAIEDAFTQNGPVTIDHVGEDGEP